MDWNNYLVASESAGTNTQYPHNRKIVMSAVAQPAAGRRQILFRRVIGSTIRIVRMEDVSVAKDGSAWGNAVVVENVATDFVNPCLFIDSSGNLHALCRKKVGSYFKARYAKSTDGGATWGSYSDVPFPSATQNVEYVGGCIGQDDVVYCFGAQNIVPTGWRMYCYKRNAGTGVWNAGINGSGAILPRNYPSSTRLIAFPSVSSFVDGGVQQLEIIFGEQNSSGVYRLSNVYTVYDPNTFISTWTLYPGPVDIELATGAVYNSVALSVPKRKFYCVYYKPDVGGINQVYFKKKTFLSNDWGAAVRVNLAQAAIGASTPSLTIGVDGRLYVAWSQKNAGITKGGGAYSE